jgi:hypothetical protein
MVFSFANPAFRPQRFQGQPGLSTVLNISRNWETIRKKNAARHFEEPSLFAPPRSQLEVNPSVSDQKPTGGKRADADSDSVSIPSNSQGGVLQYDFGKTIQDQSFHLTGFLDKPPTVLCVAANVIISITRLARSLRRNKDYEKNTSGQNLLVIGFIKVISFTPDATENLVLRVAEMIDLA